MAKILIIDDEAGLRKVLRNLVKLQGHETEEADDGRIGLEKISSYNPDLVLLDIRLPDMDGLEVLAEARKIKPTLPIIMCSGFSDVETAINTVKMGATDYLSKPFRNDEVTRTVAKHLSGGAPARTAEAVKQNFQPIPSDFDKRLKEQKKGFPAKLIGIAAAVIAVIGIAAFMFLSGGEASFSVSFQNPTALSWDGRFLWVTDWSTQRIYKMRQMKDMLITDKEYYFTEYQFFGIAADNSGVYTADILTKSIIRHNMDEGLSVSTSVPAPAGSPCGLVIFDSSLWSCDLDTGRIFKHNKDLTAVKQNLSYKAVGVFTDGSNLWTVDAENKVYKHSKDTGLSVLSKFALPPLKAGTGKILGVCCDGKNIWITFEEKQFIVKLPLSKLVKEY